MSELDTYLCTLFREFNMQLGNAGKQFLALYGDGIFPQLSTIIARCSSPDFYEDLTNSRMTKVCQSIEHIFAQYILIHFLFSTPQRFLLLVHGE